MVNASFAMKQKKTRNKAPRNAKRRRFTLKSAVKKISKFIYKQVIEEPERERERDMAEIERLVSKHFKRPSKPRKRKRT